MVSWNGWHLETYAKERKGTDEHRRREELRKEFESRKALPDPVPHKEDAGIVADNVIVSLPGVDFESEPSDVPEVLW